MTCVTSIHLVPSNQLWNASLRTSHRHKAGAYTRCQASVKATEHLLVFGLGYTGRAVANTLIKSGWMVSGTCRKAEQHLSLATHGLDTMCITDYHIDKQTKDKVVEAVRNASHILCTIPPSPQDSLAAELVLAHAVPSLQWIGYLSSTSVYGDWGGKWVNESSELRPVSSKSIQRAEAEAAWLRLYHNHGLPVHVFRLGGIYGPGRSALDAASQKGPASAGQQRRSLQQYTARCHVQDIFNAVSASMQQPHPGSIYNVVDDDPASRATVMAFAAKLLQTQQTTAIGDCNTSVNDDAGSLPTVVNRRKQPQIGAEPGSASVSQVVTGGSRAEKRVSNAKMKAEFSLALEFPSYREGLAAIHAGNRCPFD